MRFGKSDKRPCEGECRDFRRFLWWPITLSNETRWLEFATVRCRYHRWLHGDNWKPLRFVNP
jgi:hypothetical protein